MPTEQVCLLGSGELVSEIVVLGAVVAALGLSLLVYRSYRVAAREQRTLTLTLTRNLSPEPAANPNPPP